MSRIFINVQLLFTILLCSCDNQTIPSLNIKKEPPFSWEEKEDCKILYTENKSSVVLPAQIKLRGGSSSKYGKQSFRIELDEKYSMGKLPSDDDWILNATYIDKTFMRHKLSYDLFRSMNPKKNIASKCNYINVFKNGEYNGLYVLMEKVNASMIGLDKSDSMAMLFKEPPIFFEEKLSYVQDSLNYYHQKYPKKHKKDKTWYIEEFKQFLFESSERQFAEEINKWVDIENVLDWHLILLFSNNSDGILKNFYLYKVNSETPFRFAIWDYDHSYGRDGDNEMNLLERELDCNRSILIERLKKNKYLNYSEQLSERWQKLRSQDIFSIENFEKLIHLNHVKIKDHLKQNFEKWPLDDEWYFDNNNYSQEIQIMKKYVKIRVDQLDSLFSKSLI